MNKAWILLQDFEFGEDASSWILITSTKLPDSPPVSTRTLTTTEPIPDHDLAGLSISEITNFVRDNEARLKELEISNHLWVIIDQAGLDNSTGIVVETHYDYENKGYTYDFKAGRLPLVDLWGMYCNLDIANMGFEEWMDQDAGLQDDGTYKWVGPFPGSNEAIEKSQKETEAKLAVALKVAKDLGHID